MVSAPNPSAGRYSLIIREPHFGKYIDLNMLVMTGVLERTEDEFRRLLEA